MPSDIFHDLLATLPAAPPWNGFAEIAAGAVNYSITILSTAIIAYIGAAIAVALFHPDQKRRADARAVLNSVLRFIRRPRR
ncbi:hypothetical protein [Allokutzneria sp. NRRL B-24872]|uniref:hypothetical protein n=1 Tax=Allokutzneria sp. NRRL B-24872 TaxID=1137961 RepID=UPI001178B8C9|nr:hypothetical protein [Allokutzneria sp. NRRL B-24872]